jgi:hypothetical protein
MENWKKAVIFGSIGAGAVLFATGRRPAGAILAGVGAATLASEYPEKFRQLWERAPEYMDRGNELMAAISRIAQRVADLPIGNATSHFRDVMEER